MPAVVPLSPDEVLCGVAAGAYRQARAQEKGLRHKYGAGPKGLHDHVRGALGEVAASKYFNVYWSGLTAFGGPDTAGAWQVRTAAAPRRGGRPPRLIVHKPEEGNPADAPYIFVEESADDDTVFLIHGWCYGGEAQRAEYWEDPTGEGRWAYFVPKERLRPLDTLPHPMAERVVYNLAG